MITCKFEDGGEALLRHVTVGALVVNDSREILLVKRASKHRFGKYTIPGGFLSRDENAEQATLRELKEETGYDGKILELFRVNDNPNRPKEDRQNVDLLYLVEKVGGEAVLNPEALEIKWFSGESLPPEAEFAFDHRDSIKKYFQYLKEQFKLPIIG